MTDTPAILPGTPDTRGRMPPILFAIAIVLIGIGIAALCWGAAGSTLGLFLGPPALLCIVLPQVVTIVGRPSLLWLAWLLTTLGVALVWFIALPDLGGTNARQVANCSIILSAFVLCLIWATDLLLWSGIRPAASAGIVTLAALLWLTWPIWLSPHLSGQGGEQIADSLLRVHPLYAMNAVLHFDMWDHYPLMYSTLSSLDQDLPYRISRSIWPATIAHAAPAALVLLVHTLFARHRRAALVEQN